MNRYEKYLVLKNAIENLFGSEAWYALKESNYVPTWRKYAEKTLKAVELAIKDTVEIYDDVWMTQVEEQISNGLELLKLNKEIDEIVGTLAGVMINVSFLQIGDRLLRSGSPQQFQLRKGKWKLNTYRQVVYLQTREQHELYFRDKQIRKLGMDKHYKLFLEYRGSKSKLSYSEWCKSREIA